MDEKSTSAISRALREAGLLDCPNFLADYRYWLALVAGALYCTWLAVSGVDAGPALPVVVFVNVALWQPLIEELLFRGVLQGWLLRYPAMRRSHRGFTLANALTSGAFTLAHLATRPWAAALPVALPSLLFGYFRDRHASTWPAVVLHAVYNTGFFLVVRGVQFS